MNGIFGMFSGEKVEATMALSEEKMVNVALDYFGADAPISPIDGEWFEVSATVAVRPTFFGWRSCSAIT